ALAGAARQVIAGIETAAVLRVDEAEAGVDGPVGHRAARFKFGAAHAGAFDIPRHAEGRVVGDQLVDAGMEGVQPKVPVGAAPADAKLGGFRLLGLQVGIAETREIQIHEVRRLERGAPAGVEVPAATQLHAPAEPAGGVGAELLVVVVPGAGLQPVRAEAALVLGEDGVVVALVLVVGGVALVAVAQPVGADGEQLAGGELQVGLQACAVTIGAEPADEGVVLVLVGSVDIAAGGQAQPGAFAGLPGQRAADDLLDGLGIVAVVAVELVLALAAQRVHPQLPGVAEIVATAQ